MLLEPSGNVKLTPSGWGKIEAKIKEWEQQGCRHKDMAARMGQAENDGEREFNFKTTLSNLKRLKSETRLNLIHLKRIFRNLELGEPAENKDYTRLFREQRPRIQKKQTRFPLPYVLQCFRGREQELQTLRAAFLRGDRAQAISGIGGIGKTQLALAYATRFEAEYKAVLWVHAETEDSLRSGYADIARTRGLVKPTDGGAQEQAKAIAATLRWLDDSSGWRGGDSGWLLVLDNADTPEILHPYLPHNASGHVLLTTRTPDLADQTVYAGLSLGGLSPAESLTFFLDRCNRRDAKPAERKAAADLAGELGYLPLAMAHAAAYIAHRQTGFAHYLNLYRERRLALLDEPGVPGDAAGVPNDASRRTPVRATWEINLRALEREQAGGQAGAYVRELLAFCAFVDADDIPCELILPGAKGYCPPLYALIAGAHNGADGTKSDVGAAEKQALCGAEAETVYHDLLQPLLQYSLVTKNLESPPRFSVHRVLQSVISDRLGDAKREWQERAARAVDSAFPSPEVANWRLCELLQPHALAVGEMIRREGVATRESAHLLYRLGDWLACQGWQEQAYAAALAALTMRQQHFPEYPLDIAASLHSLGNIRHHQGNFEETETRHEAALAILRRHHSPDSPEMLHILNDRAVLYNSQGRWEQGEAAYAEMLEIATVVFANDPHLAHFHHNMGWSCYGQGRYEEAARWYRSALAIGDKLAAKRHPLMADSWHDLAQSYRKMGRAGAEEYYLNALRIQRKAYPKGHFRTAITLYNLAELYRDTNRHSQAEAYFIKAYKEDIKAGGKIDAAVVCDLEALAKLYRLMGRQADADKTQRQADAISRKLAADNPPPNQG